MKTRVLLALIAAAVLTSCAGLTQVTVPTGSTSFENMEVRRNVKYVLTKTYVLGIGGLSAKARNTDIIEELKREADLQPHEVLAYIHATRNINSYLGLWVKVHYSASGTVLGPVGSGLERKDVVVKTTKDMKDAKYMIDSQLAGKLRRRVTFAKSEDEIRAIIEEINGYMKSGNLSTEKGQKLIKGALEEIGRRREFNKKK